MNWVQEGCSQRWGMLRSGGQPGLNAAAARPEADLLPRSHWLFQESLSTVAVPRDIDLPSRNLRQPFS